MDFTGQRNEKQLIGTKETKEPVKQVDNSVDQFLVKSKQTVFRKIVAFSISLMMWSYVFIILYFFGSACFGYDDKYIGLIKRSFKITNQDIRWFLFTTFILFWLFFAGLVAWKYYNKIRFGSLIRRIMPQETTDQEMLSLNLVDSQTYELLKKQKVIIFEKNPIKELIK